MNSIEKLDDLLSLCGEKKAQSLLCEYFMSITAKAILCDKILNAVEHNATIEDVKGIIDGGDI